MTRKKGNLAYITNDSVRKATFKKRKEGLIKKVNKLTTLCGSDACTIIYSPYNPEPELFPSPPGVQQGLNIPDLNDLSSMIGQNLKEIDKQIERLSGKLVQEDCKLQLQVATEGMPGNGSGGDNSALVSAATTDRLLGVRGGQHGQRAQGEATVVLGLMKNC
ncbi:hypothetical protein TIFTF001_000008 [Ficus carica]|uniref:MADS-box domain-containing protein n=1 Tax=Ficus carica TaxID=3494 RepID=A0AA88CN92_FICCA|nr:hypothetical protein TIFTF001_000008 [Ficus carica]